MRGYKPRSDLAMRISIAGEYEGATDDRAEQVDDLIDAAEEARVSLSWALIRLSDRHGDDDTDAYATADLHARALDKALAKAKAKRGGA